ncbi:hypothetical protein BHM03_00049237, partial [Ensete ventricosum]
CWARIKLRHRDKIQTMQWDLVEGSLGVHRMDQEARENTPGDRLKKTVRLTVRMSEDVGLARVQVEIRKVEGTTFPEILTVEPLVSDGCIVVTQVFGRLTVAEPPKPMAKPLVPCFQGAFGRVGYAYYKGHEGASRGVTDQDPEIWNLRLEENTDLKRAGLLGP